ncbi:MAG: protein of unknown function with transrane region [Candidatus Adlerbacteria bacterium]|nr:protein of unknown function with transrane region [Candidatus Adlerbacteria bacterium]
MPIVPKEALFRKLEPYLVPAIVVLVGVGAFGLGRLSADSRESTALRIIYPNAQLATPVAAGGVPETAQAASLPAELGQGSGPYVASKNGTKYYLTTCSGAGRIKQENKVYFVSVQEAEAAGFGPAANCPGL